ncbi:MAG TPA: AraC family transcriptional regulator [Capsulimonadaceae bacterium]|jgi:AraC-like DNA-binding protein
MSSVASPLNADPRWQIALGSPPIIAASGISVHGDRGEERYLLPNLWCLHLYLYEVEMRMDGVPFKIVPGCVTVIPPNIPLNYLYTKPGKHCYIHFSVPDEGNIGSLAEMPPLVNLGERFDAVYNAVTSAVAAQETAPYRLRARIWELLCTVAEEAEREQSPVTQSLHPAVGRAQHLIELRLGGPISIETLADEVDISQSYLSKLFRKATGDTVAGYISRRRAARSFHMLANTTMPIKAVAYSVGMPDLQQFNKAIRRAYGKSPRSIRHLADR